MSFNYQIEGPRTLRMSEFSDEDSLVQNVERWKGRVITVAKNEFCASWSCMWCTVCVITSLCILVCVPMCIASPPPIGNPVCFGIICPLCIGSCTYLTWQHPDTCHDTMELPCCSDYSACCCTMDRHYSPETLHMSKAKIRKLVFEDILNLNLHPSYLKKYVVYNFLSNESYERYCDLFQQKDDLIRQTKTLENLILENENNINITFEASDHNIELFINEISIENQEDLFETPKYQKFATKKRELDVSKLALERKEENLNHEINILLNQIKKEMGAIKDLDDSLNLSCYALFCKNNPYSSSVTCSSYCSYLCISKDHRSNDEPVLPYLM